VNYFPFHVGDYAAHTAHLEPMEDLAYRRLLDQYYLREGPLPADIQATAKLVRMRSMVGDVEAVLREFFVLTDDGWTHKRCDDEIEKMQDKQAKARASAQASVNARSARQQANAQRTLTPAPADAERTLPKSQADVELPTPTPTPTPKEEKVAAPPLCGPAQSADPPPPPPPFDGNNAEALNGKAVVALAPGWDLPEPWGLDAEALGWKPAEVLREAEKFRQYWTAGRGVGTRRSVKGWRQSWSTWLDKAARDKR
jgi:uncharacterized protein YdaU (DUF1376 family)